MDIREKAQAYEPPQTKNVTELNSLNLQLPIEEVEYIDGNGKPFRVYEVVVDGEKYRVPISVIANIKAILDIKPDCTEVKVTKKGDGMNTKYTVIPL